MMYDHARMNGATHNRLHYAFVKLKGGPDAKVEQWRILDRAHRGCQTIPHILKS